MTLLSDIRQTIRSVTHEDEAVVLERLQATSCLDASLRAQAGREAATLVREIRAANDPGMLDVFMAEFGLSTEEGVALMCLAEALLRVPDAETIDDLIKDKIAPSDWSAHLGQSTSPLVNASAWALMLTGKVLDEGQKGVAAALRGMMRRMGEPVIRTAVKRAMRELGQQFVLGETIEEAVRNGGPRARAGYTFSYDMLGEAAMTADDAASFQRAYADAIRKLMPHCTSGEIRENPGISIKLSALHPRYEEAQRERVLRELVPRVTELARMARSAGMGLNIDAEEADRLDLSLDVIEAVLRDEQLSGWDGFGIVVQAYGKRAPEVIDWIHALATELDRKLMVRLVKGAYWDTEIKRAQVDGHSGFPVYTRKTATDVAYLCLAERLLAKTDRIYPQFATHNAQTVATIRCLARGKGHLFEFQRLHGMGGSLYDLVMAGGDQRCRIYAPVGAHRDLLAYLVRRLLENGANSSFVNQLLDQTVSPETVVRDPFDAWEAVREIPAPGVVRPAALYEPERPAAMGWDLGDPNEIEQIEAARANFAAERWHAQPRTAVHTEGGDPVELRNPARAEDVVGTVRFATVQEVSKATAAAMPWAAPAVERAQVLNRAADLYEDQFGALFALLSREAGKTIPDAIAELREAVDFLRYYAARGLEAEGSARGVFACVSPWNFPLAIFTGQIAAALAAGNAVVAKPAEATPLVADFAVRLLHEAGVPVTALQCLPGYGGDIGGALVSAPQIAGVCFTGSTPTAQSINRAMAASLAPEAPLIAETGGINAMIVDSTALPEQAVRDVLASAFQSAGQRCSALRVLYVQEDVAETLVKMLTGAASELSVGDPWELSTDVGPVISEAARADMTAYVERARAEGRVIWQGRAPLKGHFVPPVMLRVSGIEEVTREVFGPVLHVAVYRAEDLDSVLDRINASGFGLTFGLHTRIDARIAHVTGRVRAGNIYVNRNQIGAVVGTQPFGGEGMSGTGPKAGGPAYLPRFLASQIGVCEAAEASEKSAPQMLLENAPAPSPDVLSSESLPGPTGELNRLTQHGRGVVLCLGPGDACAAQQAERVRQAGCVAVEMPGGLSSQDLEALEGFDAAVSWAPARERARIRAALAARSGPIVPLISESDFGAQLTLERHLCVDTTAAGGNAALLARSA